MTLSLNQQIMCPIIEHVLELFYIGHAYRPARGWQSTGDDYYSYYYQNSGQSTGPRYMSNGRMALIIAVCAVVSAG